MRRLRRSTATRVFAPPPGAHDEHKGRDEDPGDPSRSEVDPPSSSAFDDDDDAVASRVSPPPPPRSRVLYALTSPSMTTSYSPGWSPALTAAASAATSSSSSSPPTPSRWPRLAALRASAAPGPIPFCRAHEPPLPCRKHSSAKYPKDCVRSKNTGRPEISQSKGLGFSPVELNVSSQLSSSFRSPRSMTNSLVLMPMSPSPSKNGGNILHTCASPSPVRAVPSFSLVRMT
mmetsp:Transcript_10624/g.44077  ORF Transcript_10624/g.44077 Transcript_10624/m.44077 type:complete len:231 (-) Transcript_10624:1561-2253(-)